MISLAVAVRDLSVHYGRRRVFERVTFDVGVGQSLGVIGPNGSGKTTLLRAVAECLTPRTGEIRIKFEGLLLMPQQPYVPLGTLRRAVTYPLSPDEVDDALVRKTVEEVGLGHFLDRLDEDTGWEHVLSGGEKQRLAFARALIHRPITIVMDEATAALDPMSQQQLMQLVLERLPEATVISVGHRAELEAFHTRKLVLEYHPEGARLVRDESLERKFGRSARFLSKMRAGKKPRKARNASR